MAKKKKLKSGNKCNTDMKGALRKKRKEFKKIKLMEKFNKRREKLLSKTVDKLEKKELAKIKKYKYRRGIDASPEQVQKLQKELKEFKKIN